MTAREGPPAFGSRHTVHPASREFGFDRGTPIDRHYIERFLERHARDIRGRVLEVGDDAYTRRFGDGQVTTRDVLHVTPGNPQATIVADLADAAHIPSDAFDCVILTQTLHLVYDVRAALATLAVLLAAAAGTAWLVRQPVFAFRDVVIRGSVERASTAHLEAVVRGELAGTFFTMNLGKSRAAIEAVPWVREVALRRQWPRRLEVTIAEHVPLARWNDSGLVDVDGDDHEAVAGVLLLQRIHPGEGLQAGAAPGGPEVDQDDFAVKRVEQRPARRGLRGRNRGRADAGG